MDFEEKVIELEMNFCESEQFISDTVLELVTQVLNKQGKNRHVAIIGGGMHTCHLIDDFSEIVENFDIIDKNPTECIVAKQYPQLNIYDYGMINNYDCLIISSYEFEREIEKKLYEIGYKGKVVGLYKELKSQSLFLPVEYYNLSLYPYISSIVAKRLLQNSKYKLNCLKHLIYISLHNRDMLFAKKYLEDYIKFFPEQAELERKVLHEIILLEESLAKAFKQRTCKDIFAFWIDALRYNLSKQLPFMNECREQGVDFTNFYSSAFSTRHTYGCIMKQSDEIDLFIAENGDNILLNLINRNGYRGYRSAGDGVVDLESFNYKESKLCFFDVASTKIIWNSIMRVLNSPEPTFVFVHTIIETHAPYISPISMEWERYTTGSESWRLLSEDNLDSFLKNSLTSAQYIDMELAYYLSLILKNSVALLFADHGVNLTKSTAQYKEDVSHLPLCIIGNEIEHSVKNGFVNTKNFVDVLACIMRNEDLQIDSDILQMNGIDYYNKTWIEEFIDNASLSVAMQYNGIRTQTDIYIINAAGEEFYYLLPDEEHNEIDNPLYYDRIQYLKSKMIRKHIDIYRNPKFKESHLIYEAQGKTFMWRD